MGYVVICIVVVVIRIVVVVICIVVVVICIVVVVIRIVVVVIRIVVVVIRIVVVVICCCSNTVSKQARILSQANVHSIVSSEDHVLQLMQLIDEAVKEVTLIEERLSSYDQVIMVSCYHTVLTLLPGVTTRYWL